MIQKYLLIAALVTLTGCSSIWKGKSSSQSAAAGSSSAPQPAPQAAKSSWMTAFTKTPAMDSSRKVNEQSCTAGGVDLTAGNLRCR